MQILTDASQLAAALSPLRMRVLGQMHEPQSATSLAPRLGLSRQTLNYHLRELEREGFLEVVEERPRRGCVERMLKVTSRAFVVNPALLGALSDDPDQARDRFSSAFLLATATRLIRDVAVLGQRARAVEQRLATFTMDCRGRLRVARRLPRVHRGTGRRRHHPRRQVRLVRLEEPPLPRRPRIASGGDEERRRRGRRNRGTPPQAQVRNPRRNNARRL